MDLHSFYSLVAGPPGYCGRAVGVIVRTCGHPGSFDDTVITARYLMRCVTVRGSVLGKVDLPVPYPHHSSTGIDNSADKRAVSVIRCSIWCAECILLSGSSC